MSYDVTAAELFDELRKEQDLHRQAEEHIADLEAENDQLRADLAEMRELWLDSSRYIGLYIEAVTGRRDFRQAFKELRAELEQVKQERDRLRSRLEMDYCTDGN